MAHDLGIRVVTWTVDEADVMHHLLDLGVDAVITDRPDVLRAVFVARDLWSPMSGGTGGAGRVDDAEEGRSLRPATS